MPDEGSLRERFPEIPWDQPVLVTITRDQNPEGSLTFWTCRYCISMHGLKAQDVIQQRVPERVFAHRRQALDHIEQEHHD